LVQALALGLAGTLWGRCLRSHLLMLMTPMDPRLPEGLVTRKATAVPRVGMIGFETPTAVAMDGGTRTGMSGCRQAEAVKPMVDLIGTFKHRAAAM